eukprot:Opistho-2@12612
MTTPENLWQIAIEDVCQSFLSQISPSDDIALYEAALTRIEDIILTLSTESLRASEQPPPPLPRAPNDAPHPAAAADALRLHNPYAHLDITNGPDDSEGESDGDSNGNEPSSESDDGGDGHRRGTPHGRLSEAARRRLLIRCDIVKVDILVSIARLIAGSWKHTGGSTHSAQRVRLHSEEAAAICKSLIVRIDEQIAILLNEQGERRAEESEWHLLILNVSLTAEGAIASVDVLVRAIRRQINKLERFLKPMWDDRDSTKNRIGHNKWKSNPTPKNDYAERRRDAEGELRELQPAYSAITEDVLPSLESLRNAKHRI